MSLFCLGAFPRSGAPPAPSACPALFEVHSVLRLFFRFIRTDCCCGANTEVLGRKEVPFPCGLLEQFGIR